MTFETAFKTKFSDALVSRHDSHDLGIEIKYRKFLSFDVRKLSS